MLADAKRLVIPCPTQSQRSSVAKRKILQHLNADLPVCFRKNSRSDPHPSAQRVLLSLSVVEGRDRVQCQG